MEVLGESESYYAVELEYNTSVTHRRCGGGMINLYTNVYLKDFKQPEAPLLDRGQQFDDFF